MQRSGRFRFFAIALSLATTVLGFFPPAARAQNDSSASDAVLAPGNPPLTESMVSRFIDFQAWLLEVPFTQQQREEQRAMLLRDWKKPDDIKNDMIWLSVGTEVLMQAPEEAEFAQVDIQENLVKTSRADKVNPDARWLVAAYDAGHRPIAAGNPPLTESMVSHFTTFVGWLLEIPITQSFKDSQRAMLLRDWKTPKDRASDMVWLDWQLTMARFKYGRPEREYVRVRAQADVIKSLRADKRNPDAQLLIAAYDAAHRPIAAGNFPLTRQAADAWTELYSFVSSEKGTMMMATDPVKDDFAHELAQNFAKLPADQQKALSEMPQTWTALRMAWVTGTDTDRQKILATWQRILPASQQGDPQLAAALQALARVDAFKARDPNTVSEQDLLRTANDADLVALQYRRQGSKSDLVSAAGFEELARTLHLGNKQAYVNLMAQWKANGERLAIMRATFAAQEAQRNATAISNMYVLGDAAMANVITNINNSPYQTIVVPVVPK